MFDVEDEDADDGDVGDSGVPPTAPETLVEGPCLGAC